MTTELKLIDNIIRIGLLALIALWSVSIVMPFVSVLLWGIIIAVSAYPGFLWLSRKMGDRPVTASIGLALLLLFLIIGPIVISLPGFADSIRSLANQAGSGTLAVPMASESVRQ